MQSLVIIDPGCRKKRGKSRTKYTRPVQRCPSADKDLKSGFQIFVTLGEGTRPTPPAKPPSCRPGALTRRPYLVHNEDRWIAARLGTRQAGGLALAILVGYAIGQWMPRIF